jgi:hypothetical protein
MGVTLTPASHAKSGPSAGGAFSSRWRSRAAAGSDAPFWAAQNMEHGLDCDSANLWQWEVEHHSWILNAAVLDALRGDMCVCLEPVLVRNSELRLPNPLGRTGKSSARTATTCGIVAPAAACDGAYGACSGSGVSSRVLPFAGRGFSARAGAVDGRGHERLVRRGARYGRRGLARGRRCVNHACVHLRQEGAFGRERVDEAYKPEESCVNNTRDWKE